jgi:hypothetical protein
MSAPTPSDYVLGRSIHEYERLMLQGRLLRPYTEKFFRAAGLVPGMRVLDVGSGVGDVALLTVLQRRWNCLVRTLEPRKLLSNGETFESAHHSRRARLRLPSISKPAVLPMLPLTRVCTDCLRLSVGGNCRSRESRRVRPGRLHNKRCKLVLQRLRSFMAERTPMANRGGASRLSPSAGALQQTPRCLSVDYCGEVAVVVRGLDAPAYPCAIACPLREQGPFIEKSN